MKTFRSAIAVVAVIVAVIAGGLWYVTTLQSSLWEQSVSEVLETTGQSAHAFEIYVEKDQEMVHGLADKLSHEESTDSDAILRNIVLFGGDVSNYTVASLKDGTLYSSRKEDKIKMTAEEIADLESRPDIGTLEPYYGPFTGQRMLGFYEKFTFADGEQGLVQKGQLISEVAHEFSLTFYDDTGFSYIVNKNGDILVRSLHKGSNHTYPNIFDVVDAENDDAEAVQEFRNSIAAGNKGAASFVFDGEDHLFAYVPIQNTDDWYLVSIIPMSSITSHTDEIMSTSQVFIGGIAIVLLLLGLLLLFVRQSQKRLMEKDREIQYREQLFDVLVKNTNDVYLMVESNSLNVEYISPNVERVLGVSDQEIKQGLKALEGATYLDDEPPVTTESLFEIPQGQSVSRESSRVHAKTGEVQWFEETVYRAVVQGADRFIIVLANRTKDRRNKEALEDALKTAQVANEAKSSFLSNMSHDIRTPMNSIMGLTVLLARDADRPDRVRDYTRKIESSSQHLLGLINDVLDMSKIESGKATINVGDVDLAQIIEDLCTIIRSQAKAKNQSFEVVTRNITSEHLIGDKLRINQVLLNILSNAVKYTPEGGSITMTVAQLPRRSKRFARLRFIVEDTGIGMSEEYQENIFKPFTREKESIVNEIQGTGLGMPIAKNLVDMMGGIIECKSEKGVGTTFTVELELRICDEDVDERFWEKHGVSHILVVDDDEAVCENVVYVMEGTGVSIEYTLDGASAIEMVRQRQESDAAFNVILLDWQMPDMSGVETARHIREIVPDDVPILILTAYDWQDVEDEARAAGINGFLAKPFFVSSFKQTLADMSSVDEDKVSIEGILKDKHFLCAEDNGLSAMVLSDLLDMEGATCEIVDNGQKAYETFLGSRPGDYDAILMDVQMPVMNGYDATRAIRASEHPCAKEVNIIAMTANAFAEDVRDALDAGMNAHIAKPMSMDALAKVMADLESEDKSRGDEPES